MNIAKWISSFILSNFFFLLAHGQPDTLVLSPINNPALNEYNLRRMAVDKNNNLWIGTDKGIVKFDGNDLTVFNHSDKDTNTLTINSLGTIYFDKAVEELFVIGVGACIDVLNTRTGKVTRLKIELRDQDKTKKAFPFAFSCLYIDTDSTVWSGMFNIGFVHFDRRTNKTDYYALPFKNESINQTVFDIQQDPDVPEILWLATYDGIYSFNKKTAAFTRKYHASDPKDSTSYDPTIICLDTRQRDTIWFTVPVYGFGYYDKKSGRYHIIRDIDKRTGKLTPHNIDRIQRRNPHEIWLSWDSGLPGVFNTATQTYFYGFRLKENYPTVQQKHYLEDSLGNFWSLMFYQLYKAEKDNKRFHTVLFPNVPPPDNLPNFFRICLWDPKAQVYYAVFDGRREVIVLDKNMKQTRTIPIDLSYTTNPMAEADVYDALIDKKGRLWLVGSSVWLYDEKLNKLKIINEKRIDFVPMVLQNMVLRGDHIYLQPSRRGFNAIYRVNINDFSYDSIPLPKEITSETSDMNQQGKQMDVLEMDSTGEIAYLCYGLTLFQFNLKTGVVKKVIVLPPIDEYKGYQHFYTMFWYKLDAKNRLWVSLLKGITIYDATSLKIIKEIPGEKDTYPLQLSHVDGLQVMCYLYSNGVILYDYDNDREFKLSLSDGLATIFNSGIDVANNTLFVGAYDYLHYTSFSDIVNNVQQRKCYISAIALFNKPFRTDTMPEFLHSLRLPYNKNYISFTISSTEFNQPDRLEYRYKLKGIDNDWVYVNYLNRTITYTNIRPGDYTLYASVKNSDGKWSSDGITLDLIIVPAWWQTTLFKILLALTILSIFLGLALWRVRAVRKQEQIKAGYEKELLELEAKALRAQMNPHFIFNCLNSIKSLINKNENEKAARYLTIFSKLIRTLFQNSDRREISLYEEIETSKLYAQLEKMRFGEKVDFAFEVDDSIDLKDIKVPALIIQPFIENAIWHGLVPRESGGKITVAVKEKDRVIECIIDDNGIGRELSRKYKAQYESAHESKGIGLTRTRLELDKILNNRDDTIQIIDKSNKFGEPAGTTVVLSFDGNA